MMKESQKSVLKQALPAQLIESVQVSRTSEPSPMKRGAVIPTDRACAPSAGPEPGIISRAPDEKIPGPYQEPGT